MRQTSLSIIRLCLGVQHPSLRFQTFHFFQQCCQYGQHHDNRGCVYDPHRQEPGAEHETQQDPWERRSQTNTAVGLRHYTTQESSDLKEQPRSRLYWSIFTARYSRAASSRFSPFSLLCLLSLSFLCSPLLGLLSLRFYRHYQGWVVPVCQHPRFLFIFFLFLQYLY